MKLSLAALTLPLALVQQTNAVPVQYHIDQNQMECHYAPIHQYETFTTSVFITSGDQLKVRTKVQGPMAPLAIASSAEVLAAAMRVDKVSSEKPNFLNRNMDLDFENLYNDDALLKDDDWDDDANKNDIDDKMMDDLMFQDYYYMDDDDEYQFMEDDAMDDMEIAEVRRSRAERDAMSPEERQKLVDEKKVEKKRKLEAFKLEREKQKKRIDEEKRKKQEAKMNAAKRKAMDNAEGMPVENTYEITDEGWYRFCVEATHATVSVEK